ncbi:MAG TPA: cupredoxin family copper-binding protein [Bacteroidales bacterium]|nr:cupredoxin family copper-binding protein [Bacteroidales bacterium]
MKNSKSYLVRKGLPLLLILLSAAISCSKDSEDYSGNNGGNGNTVKIQGFAFSPATISVKAGTTITWTNYDNVAHTVTSDDGLFDSGSISMNDSFSQKFDSTGTFAYHCTPHPQMTASVVVTE